MLFNKSHIISHIEVIMLYNKSHGSNGLKRQYKSQKLWNGNMTEHKPDLKCKQPVASELCERECASVNNVIHLINQ